MQAMMAEMKAKKAKMEAAKKAAVAEGGDSNDADRAKPPPAASAAKPTEAPKPAGGLMAEIAARKKKADDSGAGAADSSDAPAPPKPGGFFAEIAAKKAKMDEKRAAAPKEEAPAKPAAGFLGEIAAKKPKSDGAASTTPSITATPAAKTQPAVTPTAAPQQDAAAATGGSTGGEKRLMRPKSRLSVVGVQDPDVQQAVASASRDSANKGNRGIKGDALANLDLDSSSDDGLGVRKVSTMKDSDEDSDNDSDSLPMGMSASSGAGDLRKAMMGNLRKQSALTFNARELKSIIDELDMIRLHSPVKTARKRLHRTESEMVDKHGDLHTCNVCNTGRDKGLTCENDHFVCSICLAPHVENSCTGDKLKKETNYGIVCPCGGCDSAPWDSYHIRLVLDGKILDKYIHTLIDKCKEDKTVYVPAPAPTTATVYVGAEKHTVETMAILRKQLKDLNVTPLEYIPLDDINAQLQEIFGKMADGSMTNDDESRMEFLIMCMKINPEYLAQEEEKNRIWREEMKEYTSSCLATMKSFVPSTIMSETVDSLVEKGLTKEIAKRIRMKKCLWLIRMSPWYIEKISDADLLNRYNPSGQGLDAIELAAVYASLPPKFLNDPSGKKTDWRANMEQNYKEVDKKRVGKQLRGNNLRNAIYKKMEDGGPFSGDDKLIEIKVVEGENLEG